MNEAYNLLKDVVGFPEKQIPEMFTITEETNEWVIKAYRYLDGLTFGKILRAIMDKQGSYRKDETTKFAIFTLPKQAEIAGSQISHDEKVATPQIIQQEKLQAEGLPLETDQEFCIQKTVPDATLKLKDRTIAIYIDNVATHQEGDERDEFLRSRLEKLHPEIHVCVVQYKNDSAEERQRAKETIKEFLKW